MEITKDTVHALAALLAVPPADLAAAVALLGEPGRVIEHTAPDKVTDEILDSTFGQSMVGWRADLAGGIARANGCRVYQHHYVGPGKAKRVRLHVIGYPRDIAWVRRLYSSSVRQIEALYLTAHDQVGDAANGKTWSANFKAAAALRVSVRAAEQASAKAPTQAVEQVAKRIRPILRAAPAPNEQARQAGIRAGDAVTLAPSAVPAAAQAPRAARARVRVRALAGVG
jgi:hypothetical protein